MASDKAPSGAATVPAPHPEPPAAHRGPVARARRWVAEQGPWWLCSFVFHLVLICSLPVIGLLGGDRAVTKQGGDPPSFEEANLEEPQQAQDIERFDVGQTPEEPTELNTETLTLAKPAELARDAEYNDDSLTFEHKGGGMAADGKQPDAGGFGGLELRGSGPGPAAEGKGGVGAGVGSGTHPGSGGGEGSGFGGRGSGHREAMLGSGGGTRQSERAVAAALNWLARHQLAEGNWGLVAYKDRCKDASCSNPGRNIGDRPAAATALGLLPFLAAGQTHRTKGPYKRTVNDGIKYLLNHQNPKSGDLRLGPFANMYDHGLATIALCECSGMTTDKAVRQAAQAAIRFILDAQNPKDGGWRYEPRESGDLSVVGWQIMALKSGQMAGLNVPAEVLAKAKGFLKLDRAAKDVSSEGGLYGYLPGNSPSETMTAVGLLCHQYLGMPKNDAEMVLGTACLMQNQPDMSAHFAFENRTISGRSIYYWYYATQVMHNQPGPAWDKWNRKVRSVLIETQNKVGCAMGSWDPEKPVVDYWGAVGGRLMITSLSALTLEVYYRYLPLYKLDK